jgi:hypothetical protein
MSKVNKKKSNRGILAILLIVLLLAIVGLFLIPQTRNYITTIGERIVNPRTANWIVYQDKKYQYTFKYPSNFGLLHDRDEWQDLIMPKGFVYNKNVSSELNGKYINIDVDYKVLDTKRFPNLEALSWAKSILSKDPSVKIKDVIIDGKKGIDLSPEEGSLGASKWTDKIIIIQVSQSDSLWFNIQFRNIPFDSQLVSDMVSSIKFSK